MRIYVIVSRFGTLENRGQAWALYASKEVTVVERWYLLNFVHSFSNTIEELSLWTQYQWTEV